MSGEKIDLTNLPNGDQQKSNTRKSRRYLGIQFDCCNVYTRVYVNRDGTAYVGNCPKCSKSVRLQIGPGGTDNRFFTAY